jgi:hypothetical protein
MADIKLPTRITSVDSFRNSGRPNLDRRTEGQIKKQLFHYATDPSQSHDRALHDLITLGLLSQKKLDKMPSDLRAALQTLHVSAALGLSVDDNGNTIHHDFVDGERSITMADLEELTPNEKDYVTHECHTAQDVFNFINPIRNNRVALGNIQMSDLSQQSSPAKTTKFSPNTTWHRV